MRYLLGAALALALLPTAAQAHVTLQPREATAGAYTVENVRVPNETEDATTTKVAVQFPDGFAGVLYAAQPGWKVEVKTKKLATPIKTDDGEITEGVAQITWTAVDAAHGIRPGQFRDFPLSLKIPDEARKLTFKALQTYSDGKVVRWIGAEGSDEPAPVVTVTAAQESGHAAATPTPAATPAPADDDDGGGNGLAIAALALAAIALITSVGLRRRAS